MTPRALLPWLPNYLKAFGPAAGLLTYARVLRMAARGGAEPSPLPVPGLGRTVWLRPARHDISIFQQIYVKAEYDLGRMPQFAHLEAVYRSQLARGERPLVIDCGSHIGLSVLWWRRLFPEALIVAVEPSADNLAVLQRNLEGVQGVRILHGGIWSRPGTLRIQNPEAGAAAFRLEAGGVAGGALEAFTIPAIMQEAGAKSCLLAKIDIEGGEAELFSDNTDWLDRTHALVVELHDWLYPWSGSSTAMFRALSARGFDFMMQGENMVCFQKEPAALLPAPRPPVASPAT